MHWSDEGIVLGVRRHGEANAILELMTRDHGRHLGLVRGASGRRLRPVLQPGNRVGATWRALARMAFHSSTSPCGLFQLIQSMWSSRTNLDRPGGAWRRKSVTVLVWMRPCASVAGTRWTRCTPDSYLRLE